MSSCTLEALLSQTVRLIKSRQFGQEFLSQFSQKEKKKKRTSTLIKTLRCFKSNIAGFPAQTARVLWMTLSLHVGYLSNDAAGHWAPFQTDRADTKTKAVGCVSVVSLLLTICMTEQAVCLCLSVVQQVQSLQILLHNAAVRISAALLMVFAAVFSLFRPQVLLLFNFQCLHFRSALSSL